MTRAPWEADHELDETQFSRILERRFPEFHQPEVVAMEHGWDYLTFRVDEHWVFKVPKRASVVSRMRQEVSLLTALPRMTLSVPRPVFHGVGADDLRYPFFGYPFLSGVSADSPGVDPTTVLPAALDFLDELHGIVPPFAVEGWPDGTWAQRIERLKRVRELALFAPALAWLAVHEPKATKKTLLHDDFGPNHLLLDPKTHQLIAVLDWADASMGDPARDLLSLVLWEPKLTTTAHLDRGGDPATLERAYAHALLTGLRILDEHLRWAPEKTEQWTATMARVQEAVLAG